MFNEGRKQEFLDQLDIDDRPFISLFRVIEPYEIERNRDLAEFSQEDFMQVLADALGLTESSLRMSKQRINKYLAWCRTKNYPTVVVGDITGSPDKSDVIHQRMVGSPEDLALRMDRIFNDRTIATVDCLYRCYLWMLFMGFDKEEPSCVLTDSVDLFTFRIKHKNLIYEIPPTSLIDFMHAVNAEEFIHAKSLNGKKSSGRRIESPYLLRGLRTEQLSYDTVQRAVTNLQRKKKIAGDKIIPKQVRISGFFWRAYQADRVGGFPYLDPLIDEVFNGTTFVADPDGKPARDYRRYLQFKYSQDYNAWKQAFHLT